MHENDPAPKLMVKNRKIVREGGLAILELAPEHFEHLTKLPARHSLRWGRPLFSRK